MENPSAFPMGEPNDGFAQYFVGQSYLAPVLETPQIAIHNVTFEPGCRNNWHIHHNAAQVLIAVGGRGYYQIEGQEPKELKAGGCRSLRQTCLRSVVLIWRAILQKWDGPFCCSGR